MIIKVNMYFRPLKNQSISLKSLMLNVKNKLETIISNKVDNNNLPKALKQYNLSYTYSNCSYTLKIVLEVAVKINKAALSNFIKLYVQSNVIDRRSSFYEHEANRLTEKAENLIEQI